MKICIVGWYGTETQGDIAILFGIIKVLSLAYEKVDICLGSLYPFYTERTMLYNDMDIKCLAPNVKIEIFDFNEPKEIKKAVSFCDEVIMGGGPLMDLVQMQNLYFAFRMAYRQKKRTILFGCGVGPFKNRYYIKILEKILNNTSLAIFRDSNSLNKARKLNCKNTKKYYLPDPAIIAVGEYINTHEFHQKNYAAVNFREIPEIFRKKESWSQEEFYHFVGAIKGSFESVLLVPMHTFGIGGDDRKFFHQVMGGADDEKIVYVDKPQSLYELFRTYAEADLCVGMRYHSVVFQTLLNGKNLILDYTDGKNGKIQSFLQDIDQKGIYKSRTIDVVSGMKYDLSKYSIKSNDIKFEYDKLIFEKCINNYLTLLKDK